MWPPMNHGWGMWLGWLIVLALFGALIWALIRANQRRDIASPADILRRRYASGEIDEAEYRRRLEALQNGQP